MTEEVFIKPVFVKDVFIDRFLFNTKIFVAILFICVCLTSILCLFSVDGLYFFAGLLLLLSLGFLLLLPRFFIEKRNHRIRHYVLSNTQLQSSESYYSAGSSAESGWDLTFGFVINLFIWFFYTFRKDDSFPVAYKTMDWRLVTNVQLKQTLMQKKYNVGTLELTALQNSGFPSAQLIDIQNPSNIKEKIERLIEQNKSLERL